MARLAAIENALYYPTPTEEIRLFAQNIEASFSKFKILDPCCGEGEAVKEFANVLHENAWRPNSEYYPVVYGVELEELRARKAKHVLDCVVHAPFEEVEFNGFPNVIFANPPYDEIAGKRVEITWVNHIARLLPAGAVAVLVLPDRFFRGGENEHDFVMAMFRGNLSLVLKSGKYEWSRDPDEKKYYGAYRFSDKNYDAFKQHFVVVRKESHRAKLMSPVHIEGTLGEISGPDLDLNVRSGEDSHFPDYMYDERASGFEIIRGKQKLPEPVIREDSYEKVFGVPAGDIMVQSLAPMRAEIAAAVIAGGMFSGIQIGNEVIRGGITIRKVHNEVEEGNKKTIEVIDVMVANLSILNMGTGEIDTYDSDSPKFGEMIEQVSQKVIKKIKLENPSKFQPADLEKYRGDISDIHGPRAIDGHVNGLFEPQIEAAATILKGWEDKKSITLIGEMGVGKTITSIAAAVGKVRRRKNDAQKIVILVPSKNDLRDKWIQEIKTSCRDLKHTIWNVETISDVQVAFAQKGLTFIVAKESMVKRTSGWAHVPLVKRKCHSCGQLTKLVNSEGDPIEKDSEVRYCAMCGEKHLTFVRNDKNNAYYSLARYINDHYNNSYVLIVDEAHQFKGGDTARGYASNSLIRGAWRTVIMTGTLYNGYASSIFYTLYRSQGSFRSSWSYDSKPEFVRFFGLQKETVSLTRSPGRNTWSGYDTSRSTRVSEIPGIHPSMIAMMLPYTVFMKLDDFEKVIPTQYGHTLFMDLPEEVYAYGTNWLKTVQSAAIEDIKDDDYSLQGQFNWANLGVFDIYPLGDQLFDKDGNALVFHPMGDPDKLTPKEEATIRITLEQKKAGHPVLIFHLQTDRRPIQDRLGKLFEKYDMKLAYMPSTCDKRIQFVEKAIKDGADAVICNPNLVREGIDLLQFKTIIWFGTTNDAILVNQANARVHRIGQNMETHVYFLGYQKTYQSDRWVVTAKKVAAMSATHGDVQTGLAALLGDKNLIATVQDSLIEYDKAASDLTLDDLPPLPALPGIEIEEYDPEDERIAPLPEVVEEPRVVVFEKIVATQPTLFDFSGSGE